MFGVETDGTLISRREFDPSVSPDVLERLGITDDVEHVLVVRQDTADVHGTWQEETFHAIENIDPQQCDQNIFERVDDLLQLMTVPDDDLEHFDSFYTRDWTPEGRRALVRQYRGARTDGLRLNELAGVLQRLLADVRAQATIQVGAQQPIPIVE